MGSVEVPELTFKAIALGVVLAVVLAAANAYVGLSVGLTVSASIPAAVLSLGVLRAFRRHTILENNQVQTIASAGEALAAGVIFTIPALLFLGVWREFTLEESVVVFLAALLGGTLGVLFTIPLRRAFIVEGRLPYPEGVACANVLKTGESGGSGLKFLVAGVAVSALYAFFRLGLHLWGESFDEAWRVGDALLYFGMDLAPILLGVGFIVGPRISFLVFAGGAISWLLLIPAFSGGIPGIWSGYGYPTAPSGEPLSPLEAAFHLWSSKVRLVGGGAMITGGLYTLWKTRTSILSALSHLRATRGSSPENLPRTERDLSGSRIAAALLVCLLGIFALYSFFTGNLLVGLVSTLVMVVAGFFFSAVAGYMAGIVGSSNNPISGVTIVTLIFTALLLKGLLGLSGDPSVGLFATIGVAAVIASAAALAGDNLQDLKTGHLVGATPYRQQIALILGVAASALVLSPVLGLLHSAYTIGSERLPAPQATLMSSLSRGILGGTLDWSLVGLGALMGGALALLGLPVMAVAVGIYLPFRIGTVMLVGGLLRWGAERILAQRNTPAEERALFEERGMLLSSGIIAGEALLGVLVALLLYWEVPPITVLPLLLSVVLLLVGSIVLEIRFLRRWGGALLVLLLGASGSFAVGSLPPGGSWRGPDWAGLLLLADVALLLFWIPLRGTFFKGGEGRAVA